MIIFSLIYDRRQIHIGTIIYQVVYSLCVDLFANCHIYSKYMWINFFIMLLGVVFLQLEQVYMPQHLLAEAHMRQLPLH